MFVYLQRFIVIEVKKTYTRLHGLQETSIETDLFFFGGGGGFLKNVQNLSISLFLKIKGFWSCGGICVFVYVFVVMKVAR